MRAMPDMTNPKAAKGLHAVGESQIIVRAGSIE